MSVRTIVSRKFSTTGEYPVLASTGKPLMTPWEEAQSIRPIGMGIYFASTAGHGGFFVPSYLLSAIPANHRAWAKSWSGSENWYEEDCCWACVACAFPELFSKEEHASAFRTLESYVKDGTITWSD